MPKYIISVTAADRVGIVYSVTGALLDLGGNILELSQTVMRGYFTIILEVEFPVPHSARQLADTILDRGKRFRPPGAGHGGQGPDTAGRRFRRANGSS